MTECDEIAHGFRNPPRFETFDEAARYVRAAMPDETVTVIDNVAEGLLRRQRANG